MMELRESGRNPEIANGVGGSGEQDFVTLDDCINYWLRHFVPPSLKKGGTQALYRSFSNNYFLGTFPDRNVETIPAREWMQWLDSISAEKPKTANSIFTTLRACLNFCKSKFIIERTDLDRIKKQNVGMRPENGSRVPTWSELAQIWLAIERSRASTSNKTLHQLTMLWGGNRLSELRLAPPFPLRHESWHLDRTQRAQQNQQAHPPPNPHQSQIHPRTRYGDIRRRVVPRARSQYPPNQYRSSQPLYTAHT